MEPTAQGPICLAITGPTACGKTDLALALAAEFPLEIVSMDSAMVYRGMDIGTAKPDAATRERIPHHLIDVCDPEEAYSAGRFAEDCARLIGEINARGRLALVVGGTMLYLRALRDGIAPLPPRNPSVRAGIEARADESGWPTLHTELAAIDPDAARRIEPTDRQRIQRALEVHAVTGRSLTELQQAAPRSAFAIPTVALIPDDRAALAARIARRFDAMLAAGFVDEVRRLRERPGLAADSTAMRAVGYRQIRAFLDGRLDWQQAVDRAVIATRQLAKRQLTWLRSDANAERIGSDDPALPDRLKKRVAACLPSA
jgi:tRNA dimethylallyltransferase